MASSIPVNDQCTEPFSFYVLSLALLCPRKPDHAQSEAGFDAEISFRGHVKENM